jgi:hypothetical protein
MQAGQGRQSRQGMKGRQAIQAVLPTMAAFFRLVDETVVAPLPRALAPLSAALDDIDDVYACLHRTRRETP